MAAAEQAMIDDHFLSEIRHDMIKFASLQLRDDALAEDVVQDALMGAMANAEGVFREVSAQDLGVRHSAQQDHRPDPRQRPDDERVCLVVRRGESG